MKTFTNIYITLSTIPSVRLFVLRVVSICPISMSCGVPVNQVLPTSDYKLMSIASLQFRWTLKIML